MTNYLIKIWYIFMCYGDIWFQDDLTDFLYPVEEKGNDVCSTHWKEILRKRGAFYSTAMIYTNN